MIKTTTDSVNNLTIHMCEGRISMPDIYGAIEKFYQSAPTRNLIWDCTGTDLAGIKSDQIMILEEKMKNLAHSRGSFYFL